MAEAGDGGGVTLAVPMITQERDDVVRELNYARTAIRNALTELEDGDVDGAIETLRQIVGREAMTLQRRNFIGGIAGILAAGFAPSIVGSDILMPTRKVILPTALPIAYGADRVVIHETKVASGAMGASMEQEAWVSNPFLCIDDLVTFAGTFGGSRRVWRVKAVGVAGGALLTPHNPVLFLNPHNPVLYAINNK